MRAKRAINEGKEGNNNARMMMIVIRKDQESGLERGGDSGDDCGGDSGDDCGGDSGGDCISGVSEVSSDTGQLNCDN